MQIDFSDQTNQLSEEDLAVYEKLAQFVAQKEEVADNTELSINFVDNAEIKQLNRDYRQKDEVTDVISFALQDEAEGEVAFHMEDMPLMLGDIIISVDRAKEQAAEYNHSLQREMGFLIVHGFLHLLGYDHLTEEEEKIMFARQNELLGEFGLER